jgi:AcrR family transcriptional regulator
MDVALKLFVAQGVAATPVTAIEAAAGLSAGSGSFYRHFKDRNALLAAVVDRELIRVRKDPDNSGRPVHRADAGRPAAVRLGLPGRTASADHVLSVEYFSAPPADIGPERFTNVLASLVTHE